MGHPGLIFVYFRLFKQTLQFLQQIIEKNVHPVFGAGIWTHDLSEHESPPITTRPGFPSSYLLVRYNSPIPKPNSARSRFLLRQWRHQIFFPTHSLSLSLSLSKVERTSSKSAQN